jgi:MFS transporter, DHA1 family, chloramphenicol resistance protein
MPLLLYLLAIAVFAQGTSEFVLAGLLPGVAADLDVSVAQAGLLTSAFAIGMVIGAPVMAAASRRLSPRWTLTGFLALFVLVHAIGALSDSFAVLFITRVAAALANAGFLAVTLSTVTRLVPTDRRARALAVIIGGTTLALIAGVPAGAFIGSLLGWRATLWAIAAVSVPALVAVLVATPTRPDVHDQPAPVGRLRHELATLRRRPVLVSLALGVLVNAATFGTFTYLAVIATGPSGLTESVVPMLLALFGIGAFIGVTAAGRFGDRWWRQTISITGPSLLLGWALLAFRVDTPVILWVMVFVQGMLSFALGSTLITRVIATAHRAPTMGGSFATVALNLGAIIGPITAGVALDAAGPRGPLVTSAFLVLVALVVWWCTLSARRRSGVPTTA